MKCRLKIISCLSLAVFFGFLWLWLYQRPGFLHADWQEMVYDAKTGMIDDYRSWVVTWIFRQILYFIPDPYTAQIAFYLGCCLLVGYAASFLPRFWPYVFLLFVYNPLWPVSYSLLDGGVTQLFVASFCAIVARSSNSVPVWAPLFLSVIRYNFLPVGLIMCFMTGSKKKFVQALALLSLSLYTPSGVFHFPVSVEYKYHDLRVLETGDIRGMTAWRTWSDLDMFGPVNQNNWSLDGQPAEKTKWHGIWLDTLKDRPVDMFMVKLKKWLHYFSPTNEAMNHWAPPSWPWRYGIQHKVGALGLSAPFGDMAAYNEKMPASRILSLIWSPLMVYVMAIAAMVIAKSKKHLLLYSLSPLYFATFFLATVNYWAGYWSPSLLVSFWCLINSISQCTTKVDE